MLSFILITVLLVVNFAISWANAHSVGQYWSESKQVGGSFRAYVICGFVMAVAGFTMVYGCILLLLVPVILQAKNVDPEIILMFETLASDLIYLLVAAPIILSGFFIWIQSLKAAWEKRSLSYLVNAGWNSYAQIHNTINFARNASSVCGRLVDTFFGEEGSSGINSKSSKDKNAIIILALLVVVFALLAGYLTADAIMKRADAEYDLFGKLEPYLEQRSNSRVRRPRRAFARPSRY